MILLSLAVYLHAQQQITPRVLQPAFPEHALHSVAPLVNDKYKVKLNFFTLTKGGCLNNRFQLRKQSLSLQYFISTIGSILLINLKDNIH